MRQTAVIYRHPRSPDPDLRDPRDYFGSDAPLRTAQQERQQLADTETLRVLVLRYGVPTVSAWVRNLAAMLDAPLPTCGERL